MTHGRHNYKAVEALVARSGLSASACVAWLLEAMAEACLGEAHSALADGDPEAEAEWLRASARLSAWAEDNDFSHGPKADRLWPAMATAPEGPATAERWTEADR